MVYFWPYSARGVAVSPNDIVITAPARQRVLSFVGADRAEPVTGITVAGFAIVGASMPPFYTYACRGTGAGASGSGADCAADGGPDTPDETNTSPRASSHGMVYMENATGITVKDCRLKAGGIAGVAIIDLGLIIPLFFGGSFMPVVTSCVPIYFYFFGPRSSPLEK